jgi:hypothetical protein
MKIIYVLQDTCIISQGYVRFNDDYIKIGIMVKPVNGKTKLKMMKKIAKHLRYQNLT